MRVVIQRPDLDTCLAGAILGVTESDEVIHRPEGATREELDDPGILCIEAGGSGQIEKRNFDHHDPARPLPPAATQAYAFAGSPAGFAALVDYNEMVDLGRPFPLRPPFPSVSSLISGIRFVYADDPVRQFHEGVAALRLIALRGMDPFDRLPELAGWAPYLGEKARRLAELSRAQLVAEFVRCGRVRIAFAVTAVVGAVGALHRQGADVAVVTRPLDGRSIWKHTIASPTLRVAMLLPALQRLEPGWGGPAHGTIIGSPWRGSRLAPAAVRAAVLAEFQAKEVNHGSHVELDR